MPQWGEPSPVPGISRCCKSHPPALVYGHGVEDEPSRGLRGQLLVLAMNFVIVCSLTVNPWNGRPIHRTRFWPPKGPRSKTNLIPQSDSRPATEVTTEVHLDHRRDQPARIVYPTRAVTVRFGKYRKDRVLTGRSGPGSDQEPATVKRER